MSDGILNAIMVKTCRKDCRVATYYDPVLLRWVVEHWDDRTERVGAEERTTIDDYVAYLHRDVVGLRSALTAGWLRSIHAYQEGRRLTVIQPCEATH